MARPYYSIVIAVYPVEEGLEQVDTSNSRLGEISVDWVDFTRDKTIDRPPPPPMMKPASRKRHSTAKHIPGSSTSALSPTTSGSSTANSHKPDDLSLQPLLGHVPGPHPLETSSASGISTFGRGIVHLFRHAPPPHLIASLDAHPVGESSSSAGKEGEWAGEKAEGEDGSLIAILAVPAWMRPADFLEYIGGWATCLEGVRMIRCVFSFSHVIRVTDGPADCTARPPRRTVPLFCSNSATHSRRPTFWSSSLAGLSRRLTVARRATRSEYTIWCCTTSTLPAARRSPFRPFPPRRTRPVPKLSQPC